MKRPPIDELLALFRASIAAEGITTGAGDAAGDSFIDAKLIGVGDNSFVSMLAILYPGDLQNVDSKDITDFDNATGEVTLAGAYKGAPGAIPAGVPYKIVTFRFVPAEVAALTALVQQFQGLCYYGVVTAATPPNQFTIPTLAGHGDTAFCNWVAYVFWDTAGVDAPPQRESQPVATYGSATGIFTAPGFTAAVDVGDIILILHPRIAQILDIKTQTDKIAGSEADAQVAGLDLAAGPTEVFTISTTTRKKVHMLMVSMVNCSAAATITVDLSTKINGVMTQFYSQEFIKDTDPDGIMAINGTLAILADLKVEMTSSDAGDSAVTVPYSYILEDME